jgi:putative hemin transport protein
VQVAPARDDEADRLLSGWQQARARGLNNRAAAISLQVSEAQLLASACGGFATRLLPQPLTLLARLPAVGEIKAVVRNPHAVLERAGVVLGLGPDTSRVARLHADRFELDCEIGAWRSGFALEERSNQGTKLSLQFFTAEGVSAAKFFLRPGADVAAFRSLVQAHADADQSRAETVSAQASIARLPLEPLAAAADDALFDFLHAARSSGLVLTFLVRSPGATLSASKRIERVKRSERGEWLNVLDDGLDLHLHQTRLRYLRAQRTGEADAGWVHWLSDQRAVALSVHCHEGWSDLCRAAGLATDRSPMSSSGHI